MTTHRPSSFTTPHLPRPSPSHRDHPSALHKPHSPLSCPCCNSLETKFCYFNNYNLNQPRHFCRSCQRYWTAGGTLRNLPIGAGRRKAKNYVALSTKPHSDRLHAPVLDMIKSRSFSSAAESSRQKQHCNTSVVLPVGSPSFSVRERLKPESLWEFDDCESSITGSKVSDAGFQSRQVSLMDQVPDDDSTLCSFVTTRSPSVSSEADSVLNSDGGTSTLSNVEPPQGFSAPENRNEAVLPLLLPYPGVLHNATAYPGAIADVFSPVPPIVAPLWIPFGCGVPLNFAWSAKAASAAASTLGKRPRSPAEKKGSLCVPKTLRIAHPEEAAQSSILTSLGFGGNQSPTFNGHSDAFQSGNAVFLSEREVANRYLHMETQHRHTNPAAQARSVAFQEAN